MIVEELKKALESAQDSQMVFFQVVPNQSVTVWHDRIAVMIDGKLVPTFYCEGDPELTEFPKDEQIPCVLISVPHFYT